MAGGTSYELAFTLTNPASQQASSAVSVAATIWKSGAAVGSISAAAMTKPATSITAWANGADPFHVVEPLFTTKAMAQSTPVWGVANTLTATLVADFQLLSGSTITLSGLRGTTTSSTASMAVTTSSNLLGSTGVWQNSGSLVLTVASGGLPSSTACVISFEVTNGFGQWAPAIFVTALVKDAAGNSLGSTLEAEMTYPNTALWGVHHGANPLRIHYTAFYRCD